VNFQLTYAVVQGKIPKNDFGNIDLYVPSMLPPGGTHIPCEYCAATALKLMLMLFTSIVKGVAKIARKLGFDYAEAVVSYLTSCYTVTF
jgi:xeroderma pigmentosum group C-complementing protein